MIVYASQRCAIGSAARQRSWSQTTTSLLVSNKCNICTEVATATDTWTLQSPTGRMQQSHTDVHTPPTSPTLCFPSVFGFGSSSSISFYTSIFLSLLIVTSSPPSNLSITLTSTCTTFTLHHTTQHYTRVPPSLSTFTLHLRSPPSLSIIQSVTHLLSTVHQRVLYHLSPSRSSLLSSRSGVAESPSSSSVLTPSSTPHTSPQTT